MVVVIPSYQPQAVETAFKPAREAPPDCLQEADYDGIGYHTGVVRAMIGRCPAQKSH